MFVYDTAMFRYHSATVIVAKLSEQIDRFDHAIEIARWQHPAVGRRAKLPTPDICCFSSCLRC